MSKTNKRVKGAAHDATLPFTLGNLLRLADARASIAEDLLSSHNIWTESATDIRQLLRSIATLLSLQGYLLDLSSSPGSETEPQPPGSRRPRP
jgi:hypothetical protein